MSELNHLWGSFIRISRLDVTSFRMQGCKQQRWDRVTWFLSLEPSHSSPESGQQLWFSSLKLWNIVMSFQNVKPNNNDNSMIHLQKSWIMCLFIFFILLFCSHYKKVDHSYGIILQHVGLGTQSSLQVTSNWCLGFIQVSSLLLFRQIERAGIKSVSWDPRPHLS